MMDWNVGIAVALLVSRLTLAKQKQKLTIAKVYWPWPTRVVNGPDFCEPRDGKKNRDTSNP
jgi:hypothetical protein